MYKNLIDAIKDDFLFFDVYINQNCNLNCNSCIRCAPLYEYKEYPLNIFERDLKRLSEMSLRFCCSVNGGEPLLNKHLLDYLKISVKYSCKTQINTNGILIPTLSKEVLKFISENFIHVIFTEYPVYNAEKIIKILEDNNILYYRMSDTIKNLFSNSGKLMFQYNRLGESRCDQNYAFNNCRECAGALYFGKFFQCGKPLIAKKLNETYSTNFKIEDSDYIDIFKVQSIDDFNKFRSRSKHFCGYCKDKIRSIKQNTFEWTKKHKDLKSEFIEFKTI